MGVSKSNRMPGGFELHCVKNPISVFSSGGKPFPVGQSAPGITLEIDGRSLLQRTVAVLHPEALTMALISSGRRCAESAPARLPLRILITPPGRSLVARISAKVSAGSGNFSDAMAMALLPVRITGASSRNQGQQGRLIRRKHGHNPGRFRDGKIEVRARHRIDRPKDLGEFVRPARKINQPVNGQVDFRARPAGGRARGTDDFFGQCVGAVFKHFRRPIKNLTAKISGLFGPAFGWRLGRPRPRPANPCARRWQIVVERPALGIAGGQATAAFAANETTPHIHLVSFTNVQTRVAHECRTVADQPGLGQRKIPAVFFRHQSSAFLLLAKYGFIERDEQNCRH